MKSGVRYHSFPRRCGGSVTRMRDDGGACDFSSFLSIDIFIKDTQYFPPVPPWLPPPEEVDDEEVFAFAVRTTREVM